MRQVRGTVQADILKEDQAQNTCIFSTEFALRMMGDIQTAFVERRVKNFYSVSISGYHIAEAGANPLSQLAFTLANGFTYVEYYLARGMKVDDFAPNLSFFFSNGMDPEYTVMGRVARRIWATAVRARYGGNERSAKLKYHIQTSGRSLHAQEIAFNDIRTTLQALLALADNCNSLHTNAYDEAITTPTEESVRRALAIQMISSLEFGLLKNENPWQGSHVVEWLTDRVEAAVLEEFTRLAERGDVLVHIGPRGHSAEQGISGEPIEISSEMYERFGGLHFTNSLPNGGCALHLIPVAFAAARRVHGKPVTVDYPGLLRVYYDATVARSVTGKPVAVTVRVAAEMDVEGSPPFVLIHNEDRLPLNARDGRALDVVQVGLEEHGTAKNFMPPRLTNRPDGPQFRAEVKDQIGFVRLFAQLPAARLSTFALMDPPVGNLTLQHRRRR